jgi:orotate phosphoribosyltransferase
MQAYQQQFIEFMVRSNVLMFGDFTTKSGRKTPFFINTGRYQTGAQMAQLGRFYAQAVVAGAGDKVDLLFGPAYKGIPLVVTTAVALSEHHGRDLAFAFNRKEAKDHGEGGSIIGHAPKAGERVVIIEDVTTAGTSVRETVAQLKALADVTFTGLVVSVDRMEKGAGEKSAVQEIREGMGIPVYPIVTLDDIVSHLHGRSVDGKAAIDDAMKARIDEYRAKYGVKQGR